MTCREPVAICSAAYRRSANRDATNSWSGALR
jgi:hypothetical protein